MDENRKPYKESLLDRIVRNVVADGVVGHIKEFMLKKASEGFKYWAAETGVAIIEFIFLDNDTSLPRTSGTVHRLGSSKIAYDKVVPASTTSAKSPIDFDLYPMDTRGEAEEVLARLRDNVRRINYATIADMYDYQGVAVVGNFEFEKWGWTNLDYAKTRHTSQGWILQLPAVVNVEHV